MFVVTEKKRAWGKELVPKSWLIGKDPDAGKDWGMVKKRVTEDKMVWWYHQLNGHEFEQTPGDSEGHRSQGLQSMGLQRLRHDLATKQQQQRILIWSIILI